ncbi:MAG: DUF3365 domain-containing protein [Thermoanaerobaculia bacterium]
MFQSSEAREYFLRTMVGIGVVVLTLGSISCRQSGVEVSQQDMAKAQENLLPFKQELKAALVGALAEGAESSIQICREEAPAIAARVSEAGVTMGRTSHRLRNPDNAPEPWMEPLLSAYLENPENAEPRAVDLGGGTFGYVEPIYIESFCLSCHGITIAPEVEARIQELYPQDQARGYRVEDFRGMFWIKMPLGEVL